MINLSITEEELRLLVDELKSDNDFLDKGNRALQVANDILGHLSITIEFEEVK